MGLRTKVLSAQPDFIMDSFTFCCVKNSGGRASVAAAPDTENTPVEKIQFCSAGFPLTL